MLNKIFRTFSRVGNFEFPGIQGLNLEIPSDTPGALAQSLQAFERHNVNLTHIESKPTDLLDISQGYTFVVDFDCSVSAKSVDRVIQELNVLGVRASVLRSKEVPWFPCYQKDLDVFDVTYLSAGSELDSDHPGFHD